MHHNRYRYLNQRAANQSISEDIIRSQKSVSRASRIFLFGLLLTLLSPLFVSVSLSVSRCSWSSFYTCLCVCQNGPQQCGARPLSRHIPIQTPATKLRPIGHNNPQVHRAHLLSAASRRTKQPLQSKHPKIIIIFFFIFFLSLFSLFFSSARPSSECR